MDNCKHDANIQTQGSCSVDNPYRVKKVGRPVKFSTPEEIEEAINLYLASCWEDVPVIGAFGPVMVEDETQPAVDKFNRKGEPVLVRPTKVLTEFKQVRPYTVTGLAIAVGITRESLLRYQDKPEFAETVTRAKEICQQYAEEQLFLAKNSGGAQFSLMNNWGWKTKSEQDLTLKDNLDIAERARRGRERADAAK